jgi:hypothetical protein
VEIKLKFWEQRSHEMTGTFKKFKNLSTPMSGHQISPSSIHTSMRITCGEGASCTWLGSPGFFFFSPVR